MATEHGLFEKMAKVMASINGLSKNGQVKGYDSYSYMSKDDVYELVRKSFGENGIAFFPMVVGYEQHEVTSSKGNKGLHSVVHMKIVLACKDTGQTMECDYVGEATDYGDKGIGKAVGLGVKYFLINTLCISTGDEDTDEKSGSVGFESSSTKSNRSRSSNRNQPTTAPRTNGNHIAKRRVKVLEGTGNYFSDMNDMMQWANSNGVNWDDKSEDIIAYINTAMANAEAV